MKLIYEKVLQRFRRNTSIAATRVLDPIQDPNLYKSSARADQIVQRVGANDFASTPDCHMLVCPAGRAALNAPIVTNRNPPTYRIQEPYGVPRQLPEFPSESFFPDLTISRISNVTCVPGGVAISCDGRVIAETFTSYWDQRFHHELKKSAEGYRLKTSIGETQPLAGRFFFLDFQHLAHYGHFIADVLPRLWGYYHLRDLQNMPDLKILITRKSEKFIKEILDYSDLNHGDIIEIDRPVMVEEVFFATKALQLQDYSAPVLRQVWNTIGIRAGQCSSGGKRIYLSRSRHPQRQLLNEIDVERIFQSHGFEIVFPETLSFSDQVKCIAEAELIAGPSGSNLFTLAFQQKMKSAFIITSPLLIHITDSLLQIGRKCELRTYIGEVETTHPSYDEHWVHSPWKIADIDDLTAAVETWVRNFS